MQLIILCIMFEAMGCSSLRVVRPLAFEMDVSLGSQLCESGSEDCSPTQFLVYPPEAFKLFRISVNFVNIPNIVSVTLILNS